ncbi:MAG: signal peptidase I [Fimbriimonadaceae bacterium]|nr:signal peptidase I [Fimbriimonadaceae bacterium]
MAGFSWRRRLAKIVLGSALGAGLLTAQPYRTVVVAGDSMAPTFQDGQWVLMDKRDRDQVSRGDVVVLKANGERFIKRVAYVEGEQYFQWWDGRELIDMPYGMPARKRTHNIRVRTVPEGYVYVLGDNVAHSEDSRDFGPVPVASIVGVVRDAEAAPAHAQPARIDSWKPAR